jgi:hypothetical protein
LSCPCIATDNSKGEHCYYISLSYSEEASDDTSVLWNSPCRNCQLVTAAWQNSNVLQARKHMVDYRQNRLPKLTPDNSRFFPIFPDSPITPDNSQFFPRGLPNNGISLGGILFYFWSFSAKCQIPDILWMSQNGPKEVHVYMPLSTQVDCCDEDGHDGTIPFLSLSTLMNQRGSWRVFGW